MAAVLGPIYSGYSNFPFPVSKPVTCSPQKPDSTVPTRAETLQISRSAQLSYPLHLHNDPNLKPHSFSNPNFHFFFFILYPSQGQNSGPKTLCKSPASKAHSQTRIHSCVFCPNKSKYYPNTLQDGGPFGSFLHRVHFSLSVLSPRLKRALLAASTENHIHSTVSRARSFYNLGSSHHALMIIFTSEQTHMR